MNENVNVSETETDTTGLSALALLWMDTAYILSKHILDQENRFISKANEAEKDKSKHRALRVPSLSDLQQGKQLIGGFHTYFVEAEVNPDDPKDIKWVAGNKVNLVSITYNRLERLTTYLMEHADDLVGVDVGPAAYAVMKEREKKEFMVPDLSGPTMEDFMDDIAAKVYYYGSNLIRLIRGNGGQFKYNPKSQLTIRDFENLLEVELSSIEDNMSDPVDIDHSAEMSFSIDGLKQEEDNKYTFDTVELEEAQRWNHAFIGWNNVLTACDGRPALIDQIHFQAELTKARLKDQRNNNTGPVKGKAA
jgi:hypothetical protein